MITSIAVSLGTAAAWHGPCFFLVEQAADRRGRGPMKRKNPIESSMEVLNKADTYDSNDDAGLWEVAAMVYVGDIYALVALGEEADAAQAAVATPVDSVWPFIR